MSFSWPWALLGLLVIPLVFAIWWWSRRRRRRDAISVTSIALVRAAVPGRSRWRRRIPAALLAAGFAVLGVGAARPQVTVPVPSTSATILLALDISGSMCSTDVNPNRITAAEKATSDFISSQAGGPRIGLVTFAGTAGLLVPPTHDTQALLHALDGLATSRGTAIGQAILTSLDVIAQADPAVAPTGVRTGSGGGGAGYADDAIVVLTDGANTQGVDPLTAARQAANRHVRVFTIGFGTTHPAPLVCDGLQYGGGFGGFGGFGGGHNPLVADDAALKRIAATTGATFYRAQNAGQLQGALGNLPGTFTIIHKHVDIAAWL
ncbi:MAG TPA: VWA domain-containing protein, partial [Streptosporangiaceae bacterium]